jgi:hypothetical protein
MPKSDLNTRIKVTFYLFAIFKPKWEMHVFSFLVLLMLSRNHRFPAFVLFPLTVTSDMMDTDFTVHPQNPKPE